MKKINSALGIYPTRTSRVSSIDTANQSLESVVFQQGKSILDFDLNVMQDIIAKNQQRFVQSIYKSSGFLTNPNIPIGTLSSNTLTIQKSFVNIQGNIFTIASAANVSTNSQMTVTIDSTNVNTFVWLEAWYQEVVPTAALGETISSNALVTETKNATIYKYGGTDTADNAITNIITDPVFGAETTRRIQLRWRLRTSAITTNDVSLGFITGASYTVSTPANSNVKAQGGRSSSFISTNASTNPYTFYRADNYDTTALSSPQTLVSILSDTVYRADMQKSFLEFADNDDSSLYIAGRGTDDDAQQLNTVDGRVYGLPLAVVTKSGSTYTSAPLANTIATSAQGTTVVGPTNNASITLTAQYTGATATTNNPGQANLASGIAVTTTQNASQDILLNSYDYSTILSYVVAKRLSVIEKGTAANPSITFESGSNERNTGFYRTTGTPSTLGVSVAGNAIGNFSYTSPSVYGLSIGSGTSGSLFVAGTSTLTGNVTSAGAFISSTSSSANSLPTLTSNTLFSSSNVAITGGTISSAVTLTLKNSAGAAPTATGAVQWDSTSRTLKVGYNGSATYSYGYLGTATPTSFLGTASTVAAVAGSSSEVARIDHVHAQPSSYNPSVHAATHGRILGPVFTGRIDNGTINTSGMVLTVTAVTSGTIVVGQTLSGTNITGGPTISAQTSGTTGGVGTYTVSSSQNTVALQIISGSTGTSGSDPFASTLVLDALARVGISVGISSGTVTGGNIGLGYAVQKRRLNVIAGSNITLSFGSGTGTGDLDDVANLTIAANVAGFQDTWTKLLNYTIVNATSMVNGTTYTIYTRGTTDFTLHGAASNQLGTIFTANAVPGTGTGTVYAAKATFLSMPSAPGDVGSWGMFPVKYMVAANDYIIGWLGSTSQAQWNIIAGTTQQTYQEGSQITASSAVTTLDFSNYGSGVVYPSSTQQFAAHREHTHPRLDGYYTSSSTLPIDGQGSAGTSVNISRGDHTHSFPSYIARQGGLAFGFGAVPLTISNALDVSGTSTYTSLASSLYVRSSAAWAADSGARIALGGAVNANATPTFTAFGGISARKASSVIDEYAGYLSLWVNAGSTTALTEFFRGYDNGSIYIGRTSQSKPSDADSVVVQGKITAASFVVSGGTGVSVSSGGTGTTTYAVGDILYADSTTTLAKLTKPASATSLLTMTTTGVPAWASLANTGITGVGTITAGAWNGTVGATTPNTGAFTTITTSDATEATSTTAASVAITGGLAVAKKIFATSFNGALVGTIGVGTANSGAFTTLTASSTISGTIAPRCFIAAQGFIPATTSGASFSLLGGMYKLDFSSTATTAFCYLIVPPNHNGGKIKAKIYGSAVAFTVTPEVNTDLGTATFASGSSVTVIGATTGGTLVDLASTITAGVPLQLKITCSSTASLYGLYLEFCG